jgi:hypothetical protein
VHECELHLDPTNASQPAHESLPISRCQRSRKSNPMSRGRPPDCRNMICSATLPDLPPVRRSSTINARFDPLAGCRVNVVEIEV